MIKSAVAVDKYQTAAFDGCRYSVPRPFAFQMVTVKGYVDKVVIAANGQVVATHARSLTKPFMVLDPLHYLATLGRKPGASITRRCSATGSSPRASPTFAELERLRGGTERIAQVMHVLQLLGEHPMSRVAQAIEACLREHIPPRRGRDPADAVAGDDRGQKAQRRDASQRTDRGARRRPASRSQPLQPTPEQPRRQPCQRLFHLIQPSRTFTERNPPMADVTTELLKTQLRQLRLPTMGREFEKLARDAASSNQTFTQFLLRLTELELATRTANAVTTRIKDAGFPVEKDFDSYDFGVMPNLSKPKILELARCEWISQKTNCCFVGSHGTGKTHISIGLGLAACRAGLRVRFFTAAELVNRLEKEQKQYTLDRFLTQLEPGPPVDLRRAGLRDDEPRRRRASVPRLRRPLRTRQHPRHEQSPVQRVGPDLPGRAP